MVAKPSSRPQPTLARFFRVAPSLYSSPGLEVWMAATRPPARDTMRSTAEMSEP